MSTSSFLTLLRQTINKNLEIVVELNNRKQKTVLKFVLTDVILKDLNTWIEKMGHHPVKAIKNVWSGNFAIFLTSNKKAKNLSEENGWTSVLGENARIVNRT